MGDYPKQVLATWDNIHRDEDDYEYRDLGDILGALAVFDDPDTQVFVHACREAGIKPITPILGGSFIYCSIAPA